MIIFVNKYSAKALMYRTNYFISLLKNKTGTLREVICLFWKNNWWNYTGWFM